MRPSPPLSYHTTQLRKAYLSEGSTKTRLPSVELGDRQPTLYRVGARASTSDFNNRRKMSSVIAFSTTSAVPLLPGGTALPLWHRSSPAVSASCAVPRARARRRVSFQALPATGPSDADKAAEESYYQRQAARKTFADDVQASIEARQREEQRQQQAAARKAAAAAPPEYASEAPQGSSIRDVRRRNRDRVRSLSGQRQQQQQRPPHQHAVDAFRAAATADGLRRQQQRQPPAARAGGAVAISHDANMRQGKFLFTVKQMTNRRDFAGVLRMLREAEGTGEGATPKMYSCCIGYMGKGGNWEGALDVLGRMQTSGKTPDAFCINDAMNACRKAGKFDKALWVFEQARDVWGAQLDSYVSAYGRERGES